MGVMWIMGLVDENNSDDDEAFAHLSDFIFQPLSSVDISQLIVESYRKFGFITSEQIERLRNTQRLKVVQVEIQYIKFTEC